MLGTNTGQEDSMVERLGVVLFASFVRCLTLLVFVFSFRFFCWVFGPPFSEVQCDRQVIFVVCLGRFSLFGVSLFLFCAGFLPVFLCFSFVFFFFFFCVFGKNTINAGSECCFTGSALYSYLLFFCFCLCVVLFCVFLHPSWVCFFVVVRSFLSGGRGSDLPGMGENTVFLLFPTVSIWFG